MCEATLGRTGRQGLCAGRVWLALGFLLVGLLLTGPADAACTYDQLPTVRTEINITSAHVNTTRSFADLGSIPNNTHQALFPGSRVAGLTLGDISNQAQLRFGQDVGFFTGDACIWVQELVLQLNLKPVIYLAQEMEPGSCAYRTLLAHEQKHVAADRQLLLSREREIGDALRLALLQIGAMGPVDASLARDVQRDLTARIGAAVDAEMQKLGTERDRIQQGIDSQQEYARLAAACQ